ncbi:MAG: choice-of-anchor Q domain-containing protein [Chloroflexota bacterium]
MNPLRVSVTTVLIVLVALLITSPAAAGGTVTNCANDTDFSNQLAGGGTVDFNCGTATVSFSATRTIAINTTIDGAGKITLSGNSARRLFVVNNGASLTLKNLVLKDASATDSIDGGAVRNLGSLTVNSSTFSNDTNTPGFSAGAIFSSGTLHVSDSEFDHDEAGSAGAIWEQGGGATIDNTTFSQDKATNTGQYGFGGAVLLSDNATGTVNSSTFSQNTARQGGALHVRSGAHLTISGGAANINSSTGAGAGIYNEGTLTQTNGTLNGNSSGTGGAIENHGSATLTGVILANNSASFGGGGIYNTGAGATATLTNVTISGNTVSNTFSTAVYGGGIENYGGLTITDSSLTGNSAPSSVNLGFGGGLYNNSLANPETVSITNSTISGNSAPNGGGILNVAAVTVKNSTIDGNNAGTAGGFENYHGTATLVNVTMSANLGTTGGAIYQASGSAGETLTVTNTLVANGASGANCYVAPSNVAPISSTGYNLSSDGTCSPYFSQGTDLNGGSPSLGPLTNNGGPTLTRMPQPLSDAIDNIPPGTNGCGTTIATDQRDYPRPAGSACDIGSVETGSSLVGTPTHTPSPTHTASPSPTVTGVPTPTTTVTPEITPTPTHAGSPTPTPTSRPLHQGDLNCDGNIDGADALRPERADAGLPMNSGSGCPALDARSPQFGDVNCDDHVDARDSIDIIEYSIGVSILPSPQAGCTPIGSLLS